MLVTLASFVFLDDRRITEHTLNDLTKIMGWKPWFQNCSMRSIAQKWHSWVHVL